MKSFKLVVTLLVLTTMVVSLGFAGNGTKSIAPVAQKGTILRTVPMLDRSESDRQGPPKRVSSSARDLLMQNRTLASPVPDVKVVEGVTAGLSGNYSIKPSGDFPTIGDAVKVLNFLGVSGDVTFTLDSTVYDEGAITFGPFPGAGTHTVTIKPAAATAVTINFVSTQWIGKGFSFNGAKGITIDGIGTGGASLSIGFAGGDFPLSDPFGSTIYITGASDNIAIKNASIQGQVNDPVWANQTEGRSAIFIFTANADASFNSNITFDNLTITRATYGIKCLPESPLVTVDGLTVTNCKIGAAYGDSVAIGGFYEYPTNVLFANNVIDGSYFLDWYWNNTYTEYDVDVAFGVGPIFFNLGQSTGSHFISVDAGVFHDNIIRNVGVIGVANEGILTYGSRVSQGNNGPNVAALVYNNRIYDISNPGGSNDQLTGLRGTAGHVYHNSIRLTGTVVGGMVARCLNGVTDAYNNALSNEMTGPTPANITAIVTGGTIDYNAAYSTGRFVSGFATAGAAVAGGVNVHGTFGAVNFTPDLHLDPAGPSSAENMGKSHVLLANDIDGNPRDTTDAGTRDAGADEVSAALASQFGPDVFPTAITSPASAGVPFGLAQIPAVGVKNNGVQASAGFNLTLTISDGYTNTVAVPAMAVGETRTYNFPTWTAAAPGIYQLTAFTDLSGDVNILNDTVKRPQPVSVVTPVTDTTFTWNGGAEGWTGAVDFVRSSSFTKLGGPYNGTSWVTNSPLFPDIYTEGQYANTEGYAASYPGPNTLTSDWYDISGIVDTSLYVSFYHSINTEPGWDASWMEYTVDGVSWHHLGKLNDPDGVNWYAQSLYKNALSGTSAGGGPPDSATLKMPNYNLFGPGSSNPTLPISWWTSNGDPGPPLSVGAETGPQGPDGWIFAQLKIHPSTYPAIIHSTHVKFRYVAFSDAVASYAGWAVDNFHIGGTGTVFAGGIVQGTVYTDVNGNFAIDGGDTPLANDSVDIKYFGVKITRIPTDGSGHYSYTTSIPGTYEVVPVNPPNRITDVPLAQFGEGSNLAAGDTTTLDLAVYVGSFSGTVFDDKNDNGTIDGGELGLQGWTLEAREDSASGTLVSSVVSDNTGHFVLPLYPYPNYYIRQIQKTNTRPSDGGTGHYSGQVVSGNSGTVALTGNFGNFTLGIIRVFAVVDFNGNGVKDVADQQPMPSGAHAAFEFLKNGVHVEYDTIGETGAFKAHSNLDLASYKIRRLGMSPFWMPTSAADSVTDNLATSGVVDSIYFLVYKQNIISGVAFKDADANGVQNGGEGGFAGLTVNITGTGGGSFVTDSLGRYVDSTAGPGAHDVSEVRPMGYSFTAPPGGDTSFASLPSGNFGGANPVVNFGNSQKVQFYRTFTAAQLSADDQKKPGKAPKPGKPFDPVKNIINSANLVDYILKNAGTPHVGVSGVLDLGGKEKGSIYPVKQGDVFATFNDKSTKHTLMARGLDVDNKGKLVQKKQKSIKPTKKNDILIADMMAFQINLVASSLHLTDSNLGSLYYIQAGQPFSGLTLDQIADSGNALMTKWEGVTFSTFLALDTVIAKVNAAFAGPGVTDTAIGWLGVHPTWKHYTSVVDVPFVVPSGIPAVVRHGTPEAVTVPKVYALYQNYPNPFNPTTFIQFDLPEPALVTLKVYNVLGQEVATIIDHESFDVGNQEVQFDAGGYASGVYFYRLVAQAANDNGVAMGKTFTQVKKMLLVK